MTSTTRFGTNFFTSTGAIPCLVLVAFVLRLAVRLALGVGNFFDSGYTQLFTLAQNLAAGHGYALTPGFPTAYRVPLYPLFLAALTWGHRAALPVILAQSLIGAATVWCAARLAADMSASPLLAAALTAIYPYYVVHDTALQDTSLYTFLTLVAVILLRRRRAVAAGMVLGLDTLTRATIAPFAILGSFLLIGRNRSWKLGSFCIFAALAVVSPWLLRSWRLTGSPVLATETGLELWNGNNPLTFSHYPRESSDLSKAAALDALSPQPVGDNEAAIDHWFWRQGIAYIQAHPWLTLASGFRKLAAAFGPLPSPRRGFWPDLVHLLSYTPVLLLGVLGMWRRRRLWREDAAIYLAFVTFAAVTFLFFGHTSHRAYLDVYLIVFAAGLIPGETSPREVHKSAQSDLFEAADYHGLAPLLSPEARRESAKKALFFSVRLEALLDTLQNAHIPALPLKGPRLAETLYPDPALRPFSDLDLLIHREDLPAALDLLARQGYVRAAHLAHLSAQTLARLNCEVVLTNSQGVQLDLQWAIAPSDYPFGFDPQILWNAPDQPETLLLFLSVHGAKHLWSRLIWLTDLVHLAPRISDWTRALELAAQSGCTRPVLLGLQLAHDLLGAQVPETVLNRARAEPAIQPLAQQVTARLRQIPPPAEPESLEVTRFNARLAERPGQKFRHYAALLRAPTEAELQWLPLPPALFFLYYPLRAVRMTVKYIPRLFRR